MKKLFLLLIAFFTLAFVNSCREDGDWEDGNNGGQFGFTIDRDNNFIEKGIGETNSLKFNIVPNYDFSALQTSFKFTTSLNGVLKLNGQVLTANQEYTFTNKENIFEYVGNVAGTHKIQFSVKNSKGASKTEDFELKYSVSEFTLTTTGGTANIYQGDETVYTHKITPEAGQPNTGYQIKFDTYNNGNGEVKFNGVPATLGQFYPINNIDNFTVALKTNQAGQGKLTYTIKNSTVSKPYEIQQTVIARQIVIESMNVNSLNVLANTQMSFTGVITKTPATSNTAIEYKTWLSSASNNNMNGIQTTNNVYIPYALGANGAFNINFNAVANGNYTLNIQAKDEYGNLSAIKSFDIAVQSQVWFDAGQGSVFNFIYKIPSPLVSGYLKLNNLTKTFKAYSGGSSTITNVKYTVTVNSTLGTKVYTYDVPYTGGNTIEFNNDLMNINQTLWDNITTNSNTQPNNVTGSLKVEVFNSNGQSAFIIINATGTITVI